MSKSGVVKISPMCMNYDWGKVGNSKVAELMELGDETFKMDPVKPYAEMWMGTHPSGPSKIFGQDIMLKTYLEEHNKKDLPFLLKVLSIRKALSIQAHPDKELAQVLHKERPKDYKDPNHKPELACAITEFEALCGFESLELIYENIVRVPEFHDLLMESGAAEVLSKLKNKEFSNPELLKQLFSSLMKSDSKLVASKVEAFHHRVNGKEDNHPLDNLANELSKQFPGDVGVFCAFMLGYKVLKPGQALFLSANEPHAYISGDCVEIMACSDNVVRAGLTPKQRDVDILCSMLTYTMPGDEKHPGTILNGTVINKYTVRYSPSDDAVTEFDLDKTEVFGGVEGSPQKFTFKGAKEGTLILVLQGSATASGRPNEGIELSPGSVFYQPPGMDLTVASSSDDSLIVFRASSRGAFDSNTNKKSPASAKSNSPASKKQKVT